MTISKHSKATMQILLLEDSLVSPSRLQENKKPYKTTDICGQKCLELLKKQNLPGSLERMSEILLASQTAWYSNKCTLTWKVKVSKSNRLLYQLQQSTHPTNDTEHGLWPTPTVGCVEGGEQSDRVERTDKGGYILRKKNKPHMTYGAKLSDAILFEEKRKMWPTPTANEDACGKPTGKMQKMLGNHPDVRSQGTGTLNPMWVEWLMGYPIGWTDLED